MIRKLSDLYRVYRNAIKLNGVKEATKWLFKPNSHFYNLSPFAMILNGRGSRVYQLQEELL